VNHFNEDMGAIQGNMNVLVEMMDQLGEFTQKQQQLMWEMET